LSKSNNCCLIGIIKFRFCINRTEINLEANQIKIKDFINPQIKEKYTPNSCEAENSIYNIKCDSKSKYSRFDGACNNLREPTKGMAYSCHRRLLAADFGDGISSLRTSVTGEPLPNARIISNDFMVDINDPDRDLTQINMQWGQLVVHDMTRTPLVLANTPGCCPLYPKAHPECEAIYPLPKEDTLYKQWNQTCLRNIRSIPCSSCRLGN